MLYCFSFPVFGNTGAGEEEQINEGLDLIAARMEELSKTLEKLPEPPVLNQTLEIADLNGSPSQQKKTSDKKLKQ